MITITDSNQNTMVQINYPHGIVVNANGREVSLTPSQVELVYQALKIHELLYEGR